MAILVETLDEILDNGAKVVLSNSAFIIVWDTGSHFRLWHRENGERFRMGVSFPGMTFGDEQAARGIASTYALGLLR